MLRDLGFVVCGLGFGVAGLGFGVAGLGFDDRVNLVAVADFEGVDEVKDVSVHLWQKLEGFVIQRYRFLHRPIILAYRVSNIVYVGVSCIEYRVCWRIAYRVSRMLLGVGCRV